MSSAVRSAAPTMTTHSTAVRRLLRCLSSSCLAAGATSVDAAVGGGRSTGGPRVPPEEPSTPLISIPYPAGGALSRFGEVGRRVDHAPVRTEPQQETLEPCALAD